MPEEIHDAFWTACAAGDLSRVEALCEQVDDIDAVHPRGWTGLIMACHGAHAGVARFLVSRGADVNATNSKGTTVLMYAKTPVFESGETALLSWLLEEGAEINAEDMFGKTILDYVNDRGAAALAEFFAAHGARPGTSSLKT